jgi:adenosylcobinamide-GDP ribazoletransferase
VSVQLHNIKQDLAAALVLLTRIPLRWNRFSDKAPDFNAAVWAFPVVGSVVGIVGAVAFALASGYGLPGLVSGALAVTAMVLLTGAFHEDGLADVADGFGGGKTAARKLEIMRDSRVGAYGVIAIVLAMILRVGGLSDLTPGEAAAAMIVAAMLSRLVMVYVMRYMPPARQDGLAHDTGKPELPPILVGTGLTFVVSFFLLGPSATIACFIAAFGIAAGIGAIARQQINGFTGDVLGATQQLADIAVILFLVGYWGSAI